MNVMITARHCTIPSSVRKRVEDRLQRLTRFEPRILSADVTFDLDHGLHRVEACLEIAGEATILAHGSGETFRVAVDRMTDRLGRQLKDRRERRRTRATRAGADRFSLAGGA